MSGRKLFTNQSAFDLAVALHIRASDDPRKNAGTKEFTLAAGQTQWQDYGDNVNIYLNGITLVAMSNGEQPTQQQIVIARGSPLDNQLNMHNGVCFDVADGHFQITTRQVS